MQNPNQFAETLPESEQEQFWQDQRNYSPDSLCHVEFGTLQAVLFYALVSGYAYPCYVVRIQHGGGTN